MGNSFLQIFASSPFKPIKEHMMLVMRAVERLSPFFDSVALQDWEVSQNIADSVYALEEQADELKKQIRLHLPNHLFMPVSRFDLLDLLSIQDKVANQAKDVVTLVLERHMHLPQVVMPAFRQLEKRSVDAARQAKLSVDKLDELLEAGFRGHEVHLVERMIYELDQIEQETDRLQREVRQKLFSTEKDCPPVDMIFFYKLADLMAGVANKAQGVGHRLHRLLAK